MSGQRCLLKFPLAERDHGSGHWFNACGTRLDTVKHRIKQHPIPSTSSFLLWEQASFDKWLLYGSHGFLRVRQGLTLSRWLLISQFTVIYYRSAWLSPLRKCRWILIFLDDRCGEIKWAQLCRNEIFLSGIFFFLASHYYNTIVHSITDNWRAELLADAKLKSCPKVKRLAWNKAVYRVQR